mgnify:FL=1
MRLIEVDELMDFISEHAEQIQYAIEHKDMEILESLIKQIPTAYDVDKVLEQLKIEEKLAEEEKKRCSCCSTTQWEEAKGYANGISVAIDIVKVVE